MNVFHKRKKNGLVAVHKLINGMIDDVILKQAIYSNEPIENLRRIVMDLKEQGFEKKQIYDTFYNFYELFSQDGLWVESDLISDILDMLTGNYVGKNFEFDR